MAFIFPQNRQIHWEEKSLKHRTFWNKTVKCAIDVCALFNAGKKNLFIMVREHSFSIQSGNVNDLRHHTKDPYFHHFSTSQSFFHYVTGNHVIIIFNNIKPPESNEEWNGTQKMGNNFRYTLACLSSIPLIIVIIIYHHHRHRHHLKIYPKSLQKNNQLARK